MSGAIRQRFTENAEQFDALVVELLAENDRLRELLRRYRNEVPLGYQPHMLAHLVDEALG